MTQGVGANLCVRNSCCSSGGRGTVYCRGFLLGSYNRNIQNKPVGKPSHKLCSTQLLETAMQHGPGRWTNRTDTTVDMLPEFNLRVTFPAAEHHHTLDSIRLANYTVLGDRDIRVWKLWTCQSCYMAVDGQESNSRPCDHLHIKATKIQNKRQHHIYTHIASSVIRRALSFVAASWSLISQSRGSCGG